MSAPALAPGAESSGRTVLGRPATSVWWLALAAVALRLILFLGRGDYVAFDEGWYLLLGRSLWSGEGYTLSGLTHVALSPLFPILAGGVGRMIGDPVWGGRLVAAICSGLLVVPCWSIFRRLLGERAAFLGAVLVAVAPSLAPFVAPFWIGWDLWVGAEPVLHLFLYSGIALFLRAWEEGGWASAVGCGIAFALAYLARPEAIGTFAILGSVAVALGLLGRWRGRADTAPLSRLSSRAAACALAFAVVCTPYWLYLRAELGRWALTGRAVEVSVSRVVTTGPSGSGAATNRIENMLWRDDSAYVRRLYSLDASGTRLANGYWGVRPAGPDAPAAQVATPPDEGGVTAPPTGPVEIGDSSIVRPTRVPDLPSSSLLRYGQALGVAAPWYVWLFLALGVIARGRQREVDLELLVGVPLVATSLLIARIVAVDPRTQLFLAPWVVMYAAAGALVAARWAERRFEGRLRPGLPTRLVVGGLILVLLGTTLTRLGLSLTFGSPHHVVGAENALVGDVVRRASPEEATVVSFHPALALYADRDWRVLPMEPMERIVRYAQRQPTAVLVHSVFYPPEIRAIEEPHYLIVPVPSDLPDGPAWRIDISAPGTIYAIGALIPRE